LAMTGFQVLGFRGMGYNAPLRQPHRIPRCSTPK
jgi:hypothetical protein